MRKIKREKTNARINVQMRNREKHPFGLLSGYVPLNNGEISLYRQMREAVPIIDAAVIKLIRLTGGFVVECSDKKAEKELEFFLKRVSTGRAQRGIDSFLNSYLDSMITCGRGVGEIVLKNRREIAAVISGNPQDIEIQEGESPLDFKICTVEGGMPKPLPYQQLLMFTPYNPEADSPYGVSLMRSMPFLADILMKIYNSIGTNWERSGNVRYAVVYKPTGDILDKAYAKERAAQIANEWSNAMQSTKSGKIRDFVAVGDVDIRVIGADNQILDSEVPVRQILEQLISRTGIPPFMLGLNWSSTERMSSQQADILTSEITAIRRSLNPVIERVCDLWFKLRGENPDYTIVWDEINLQDAVEEAHAELYRAQAAALRSKESEE